MFTLIQRQTHRALPRATKSIRLFSRRLTSSNASSSYELSEPIVPFPSLPQKTIPKSLGIGFPPYATTGYVSPLYSQSPIIHGKESIKKMREAGSLARRILNLACSLAKEEGITTDEVNDIVHSAILEAGAYPSPLNYAGFPKSLCTSVNEVVCHGIPDGRPLCKADIVSLDVSVYLNGVHGDNCSTVIVAEDETMTSQKRLLRCAREALQLAIDVCRPGACLSDIGAAVQKVVDEYGYDTVRKYRGHGIGSQFHIPPFVKHYKNEDKMELLPGMIFTIEPMITEGSSQCYEWEDQWTVVTIDGGRAAQFEHMVLITEDGAEVLTADEGNQLW